MRKLVILLLIVLAGYVVLNRQRIYVRDPLAKSYRNAAEMKDTRVYINYFNDAIIEDLAEQRIYLVQNWNKIPGSPRQLHCLYGIACLTEADHPEMVPLGGASYTPNTQMSDREISFEDGYGIGLRITLR